jgi:hypothetical protein
MQYKTIRLFFEAYLKTWFYRFDFSIGLLIILRITSSKYLYLTTAAETDYFAANWSTCEKVERCRKKIRFS